MWQRVKATVIMRLQRFFNGRNGVDHLTAALLMSGILLFIAAQIAGQPLLLYFYYAVALLCAFRIFSKDLYRRRRENQKFLTACGHISSRFRLQKKIFSERKTHRYLKCPSCKQMLRVPKGAGKIQITCAKCKTQITKKV